MTLHLVETCSHICVYNITHNAVCCVDGHKNSRSQASATVEQNSSVLWVITQSEVVWNRRFGTTYRFHLQGPFCSLKMWPISSPETSASSNLTQRNRVIPRKRKNSNILFFLTFSLLLKTKYILVKKMTVHLRIDNCHLCGGRGGGGWSPAFSRRVPVPGSIPRQSI